MAEQSGHDDRPAERNWRDLELDAPGAPSILLVEDDDDVSKLLVAVLESAGFATCTCRSAEEALERLREEAFDLVLADYLLPNRSGGWLLTEASAEGLLDATPALIITAYPNPSGVEGLEVIAKPLDFERLVERVRMRLSGAESPHPPRKRSFAARPGGSGDGAGDGGCPGRIELILYVNARSRHSAAALKDIKAALLRFRSPRVKLTIRDLSRKPQEQRGDGGGATRTLVSRSHVPRTFILSHVTNPALVLELLEECRGG